MEDIIYFDYNATTPVDDRVVEEMLPFFKTNFANPASVHHFGRKISDVVEKSRTEIASLLKCDRTEITFCSGATEGINLVLKGVALHFSNQRKHIVTSKTEHKAVLDTCKYLETLGFEISYLSVDKNGMIDLEELEKVIRNDTLMISIMWVNNETGVIQDISSIIEIAKSNGILFMTDATQAVGKIPINLSELNIDFLVFSGHKLYGPKGIGCVYINKNSGGETRMFAQIHGGGHEHGMRSGSLNVPAIVGLAKACKIAEIEMDENEMKIEQLRNHLESELLTIEKTVLNGGVLNRLYNTTNICFEGLDANVLIAMINRLAVSNGSACTAALIEPSHVLIAMGLSENEALSSIRFSLGKFTTIQEITEGADIIRKKVESLRSISI